MDTAQWPQEIVVKPIEEIVTKGGGVERKPRPQKERALNCPRCHSTNTKFCYYNNYSLTQPRYFCKTCRRYWTEGGSLRNIPVGGGSRKNKRSSSSSSSKSLPPTLSQISTQNPNILQAQDLKLAFPATPELFQVSRNVNDNSNNISASPSALELLNGINSSRGLNSFTPIPAVQDPNTVYTSGFPLPTLSFSLDGLGTAYPALQNVRDTFQDFKQVSSTSAIQQNKEEGNSTGYWTGMLGGGSW